MTIIDSHAHIGKKLNFDMPVDVLLTSMKRFNINFSLVSSIEAAEADHDLILLEAQTPAVVLAEKMLEQIKPYSSQLGMLLWLKPHTEVCDEALEAWISANRKSIYGLKFHPYHSKYAFNGERMRPYLEMAKRLKLPVVVHTAGDEYSNPKLVFDMAQAYPEVSFVMVHMGLGTDHKEAIQLIQQCDNLYGDSTWVNRDALLYAFEMLDKEKLLFGTDNPIDGPETLANNAFGGFCLGELQALIGKEAYECFIFRNAFRMFNITEGDIYEK